MNPFIYALHHPIEAFADFGVFCLFVAMLIVSTYALTGNVIALYDGYDKGGWKVNPPFSWVLRLAAVPLAVGIMAWLVSAMFYLLS